MSAQTSPDGFEYDQGEAELQSSSLLGARSEDNSPWRRRHVFGAIAFACALVLGSLALAARPAAHAMATPVTHGSFMFAQKSEVAKESETEGDEGDDDDDDDDDVKDTEESEEQDEKEEDISCSWEGDDCTKSKCCKRAELSCWEKMEGAWASCSTSCEELAQFGGDWTCKKLGDGKGACEQPQAESSPPEPSFFCFMVVTPEGMVPPGVKEGYEQQLVKVMKESNGGIFACDGSAVYEGLRADKGEWKSIKNTDIFIKVWQDVKDAGEWKNHDWTIKQDADAVFFPERLKRHIVDMKAATGTPIYLHNIDFKYKFMGALEVMTKEAVQILIDHKSECLDHIGNDGGEDIFTMSCLDALEVCHMTDYSILDDKYMIPAEFNLFDVDRCDNDAIVAFHPYKSVNAWMGCFKVAMKINSPDDFTSCEHRWEGEACSLSGSNDHPGGLTDPGDGIVIHHDAPTE